MWFCYPFMISITIFVVYKNKFDNLNNLKFDITFWWCIPAPKWSVGTPMISFLIFSGFPFGVSIGFYSEFPLEFLEWNSFGKFLTRFSRKCSWVSTRSFLLEKFQKEQLKKKILEILGEVLGAIPGENPCGVFTM